jgi:hypothetical protein
MVQEQGIGNLPGHVGVLEKEKEQKEPNQHQQGNQGGPIVEVEPGKLWVVRIAIVVSSQI